MRKLTILTVMVFVSIVGCKTAGESRTDPVAPVPAASFATSVAGTITLTDNKIEITVVGFGSGTTADSAIASAQGNVIANIVAQVNGLRFAYRRSGVETFLSTGASNVDLGSFVKTWERSWQYGGNWYAMAAKTGYNRTSLPSGIEGLKVEIACSGADVMTAEKVLIQLTTKAIEAAVAEKFGTSGSISADGSVYLHDLSINIPESGATLDVNAVYAIFFD